MTQNSWVGKTLSDRYQIEDLLGQGGMSAVYKAMDPNLRRVVAIKMIHSHLSDNEEFLKRFEEEAAAVAQLRHPNIIQVYDFNNDNGVYYMVLEFVPGETLHDRLKRLNAAGRRLPFEDAASFAIDICEAANYAHVRGMVHRDIKPANVMLDTFNKAILMDFGIAKIVGGQQHTATGAVIGTALYMAPEQIRGEKIDERVDVYSIGVTLFEMLHGKPPYEADSAMTLMMMHLNDPIPDLRRLYPEAPNELVAVVEKALAKDRSQRYQSAAEMATDLRRALDSLQGQASAGATAIEADDSGSEATIIERTAKATAGGIAAARTVPVTANNAPESQVVPVAPEAASAAQQSFGATTGSAGPIPPAAPTGMQSQVAAAQGYPPQSAAPQQAASRRRNMSLLAGGAAILIVLLCVVVGGALAFSQFSSAGEDKGANAAATQTAALALLDEPTDEPTATSEPTEAFTATPAPPTATPTPEESPTPMLSPTPTVPPGITYVRINDVSLDGEGNYVVAYELFEFSEQLKLDGYHLTFFFDSTPPDQVGSPYDTLYYMYAGDSPFTKLYLGLLPDAAKQMCALVTRPNHIVEQGSGNCFPLPEVAEDAAVLNSAGAATPTPTSPPPPVEPTKEKKEPNY